MIAGETVGGERKEGINTEDTEEERRGRREKSEERKVCGF
jgi:hypothetical protein